MDFSRLNVTFLTTGNNLPVTRYEFGNSDLIITNDEENYNLVYNNQGVTKINLNTDDLPKILTLHVKKLYEAFDITSKDIQSTIWSIQGYMKRIKK